MAKDYKVLYRKYRPSSFQEFIGQSFSIKMLENAILNNKIAHAYIFTGPRGTGKTSAAKVFAKTINCENLKNGVPCGECNSCLHIHENADIIEIDAASNNGVDEVRELINNVKIAPSFSKYKVYIIDEVHMLSQSAFNALLLTLEEPPSHIVFILATTNIESVPITILSRCQRYDFKKLAIEDLILHLKKVSEYEQISITDEAIEEIAYLSEGGCRDALSILSQLSTSTDKIELETVLNHYGSVSMIQIKSIFQSFMENNYNQLKTIFDNLQKSSVDYKVFIKKMIDEFFMLSINLKMQHREDEFFKIKNLIFELNDLINKINITVDPFLLVFLAITNYMDLSLELEKNEIKKEQDLKEEDIIEENNDQILKNTMDEETGEEKKLIDLPTNSENEEYLQYLEKLQTIRLNNCFATADKNLLKHYKDLWEHFIEEVPMMHPIKSFILDGDVVLASSSINIIVQPQESIKNLFNRNLESIEQTYQQQIGEEMHFIALSMAEWEKSKIEYISNIKNHASYQLKEEPTYKKCEGEEIKLEQEDNQDAIFSIFDQDKIEIKE